MDNTEQKPLPDFGAIAVGIAESVRPKLTEQQIAMFIAGFTECAKYQIQQTEVKVTEALWHSADEGYHKSQDHIAQLQAEVDRLKAAQKSMQCPNCSHVIIYGVDSDKEKMMAEIKRLKKEVRIFTERENNMT